ncbi:MULTISPECIES: DUF4097 family beta strand repeat-containing protein [unclassified Streptomyces]|uniref:DUF4097 family beta strand repeat-containing protein n=1 Tax=unclassified Streptomyces TaxID=2593676 RepID=UPI00166175BF|nr:MULTISPECIES: DUF4097 family beta strand repeat-containing protein [unclassified Streptomyces]MBD0707977.1 hypothetical protein [Streptomyces sp. CBMA291]MBD0715929.1 hypothetical protein [Streptomyces sp. CBMA370]
MVVGRATRVLFASGAVLLGALTLGGCGSADVEGAPVERENFAFEGKALTIDSDNTKLVVTPADVDDVRVERQIDGWAFLGSGPEPEWKLADGRLTLRVHCEAVASSCSGVHRVQVPRGVAVTIDDDNGGVTAEGFATPLKIRSDNGDVRVHKSTAPLDLHTANGDITVEPDVTAPDVTARSDNGTVRVSLGAVPRRVETSTDNGDITVSVPTAEYAVDATSGNGRVRVDVPRRDAGEGSVRARSDNGDVTVRTAN